MPPLQKPPEQDLVTLPARVGLRAGRAQVLVVGGGPAGLGAAYGAAVAGAHVMLAERYGFLGGNATAALVMPLMSFHTDSPVSQPVPTRLLPNDHGSGQAVVAGVLRVFLEKLVRAGGAIPPSRETGYVVPFDPEIFKFTALDLLDDVGVQYLLHAYASGVVGRVGLAPPATSPEQKEEPVGQAPPYTVVFETKSGPVVIEAKVVVDCTGDGDIAASAGAAYEIGREEDGLTQPMTLMFRMVEFQYEAFARYGREHPDQWQGVHGLWDLIRRATAAGVLQMPREDILFFGTPHEQEVAVNSTRVTRVLGTEVWDLTYAERESRRQMRQIVAFLTQYVPGFEKAYPAQSGVQIGVRETRRILGEYQLTAADILNVRRFDDVIARGSYPMDIHNPEGRGTVLQRLPPGGAYDIPLRSLIPRDLEQLLVAGRCISGTHEAHSSYRTMPVALATGQAAGVCAALAARSDTRPRDVPAAEVQAELRRQGANLGER